MQYLIEQGVNKEAHENNGMTPLHLASISGRSKVVEYLLEQEADMDKPSNDGETPLHVAARRGRFEVVQCLMACGADINAKNNQGQAPLEVAEGEEIKQAIRDVEQQRYEANFGKRRILEADLCPPPPPSEAEKEVEVEEDAEVVESSGDDTGTCNDDD